MIVDTPHQVDIIILSKIPKFCFAEKKEEKINKTFYYKLINEILENIDETKCVFLIFCIFHCSETYFLYFHWSPAGLLSFNIQINKYNIK